jgi:hypothetical protein
MALYDITFVNGITKVETSEGYRYEFPLEKIDTDTAGNYMIRESRTDSRKEVVLFVDISNKLGAGSISGYVDALAERGAYSANFGAPKDGSSADNVSWALLNSIACKLDKVIFLLQKLNE